MGFKELGQSTNPINLYLRVYILFVVLQDDSVLMLEFVLVGLYFALLPAELLLLAILLGGRMPPADRDDFVES